MNTEEIQVVYRLVITNNSNCGVTGSGSQVSRLSVVKESSAAGAVLGGIQSVLTLQRELKGRGSYRFNKALIRHDNSLSQHLSNWTFIRSPVIISQTAGAITASLCIHLFVLAVYDNCIAFNVCWPWDSHQHFKEALSWCSEYQLCFPVTTAHRSEAWQPRRVFTLDDGFLRNETTCGVSSFHSRGSSAGRVSWRVSQRSSPSITCVRELRGQLVHLCPHQSLSVAVWIYQPSVGQSTIALCWQC